MTFLRFKLLDLLVFLSIASILSAVGLQVLAARRWQAREVACASNLHAIWGSAFNYAARYGGPEGLMPSDAGVVFLGRLQSPVRELANLEQFFCPISGDEFLWGRTSYRGPASDVNRIADIDPVAADKEGNHGRGRGGNVLVKMGDVRAYEETDPLWIRARATTKE